MTFNEANTVEAFVRDRSAAASRTTPPSVLASRGGIGQLSGLGWHFLAPQNLPRQPHEVLVEDHLREALIRLNPEIAAQPDRADDVLYKLRAILMGVRTDGLVKANEEFAAWLTGERSMPFGENGEHVTDPPDRLRRPRAATSTSSPRSSPSAPAPPRSAPTSCCSSTASRWS